MAAVSSAAKPVVLAPALEKPRSPLTDAVLQFRRNRLAVGSTIFILALFVLAVTADLWRAWGFIEDPTHIHKATTVGNLLEAPMTCATDNTPGTPEYCYIFGTDTLHRDLLSRLVYGTRISFAVAIIGTTVSVGLGLIYGLIAGYFGGKLDNFMMRIVDFLYGIPDLVLIIIVQIFFKSLDNYRDQIGPFGTTILDIDRSLGGLFFIFVAIGLLSWIGIARLVRGQVLSYKQKDFVEAARAIGASNSRIIFVHLLPNIIGPLIVIVALSIPGYIFTEAGLSFLSLGIRAPTPSWGSMLADAEKSGEAKYYPQLILVPGIALALLTLAFNYVGEGLQDALDPSFRRPR